MATTKKVQEDPNLETVKLPRESGADEIVYVSVNNIGYAIKRGEPTKVPHCVAQEIRRSEAAKEKLWQTKDNYLGKSKI